MKKGNEAKNRVEFTAKTVEDALRQATEHFGVPTYYLDYEIAKDNTRSILGIVRTGEVTIRAWVRDLSARPSASVRPTPESPHVERVEEEKVEEGEVEEKAAEEGEEGWVEEEEEEVAAGMERNPPELENEALDVLTTLLDKMGVLAAVEVVDEGGQADPMSGEISPLVLNVVGDDLGALIGRRGETLRDLQFILRLILSRRLGVWPNVVVDVEGYKARRTEALRSLARRMADQVRQTGRMVVLEPMPAHERRIVHLALRGDKDVYTESIGEDDKRKVQIIPRQ
ncbi:MAG: Jag N-terminal domain-containing protein [Chloroflexi bacterium]|nr:Jag N-terminal domain-containing protein [Chloroflexota bacterium]